MKDVIFLKKMEQLEAWLSNLNTVADTEQRELLYKGLQKAAKDIQEGETIDISTTFDEERNEE